MWEQWEICYEYENIGLFKPESKIIWIVWFDMQNYHELWQRSLLRRAGKWFIKFYLLP